MNAASLGFPRFDIRLLIKSIFSTAGLLVLYNWAGMFKGMLVGYRMPIDLTGVLGVALLLCIGYELVFRGKRLRLPGLFCFAYMILAGSVLASLMYTAAPINVAQTKALRFLIVDGLAVIAPLLLITSVERLEAFVQAHIVIGVALSLTSIAIATPGKFSPVGILGSSYIANGRVIGLAVGFCLAMFGFRRLREQVVAMVLAIGLMLVPARAPLAVTVVACFVLVLCRTRHLRKPSFAVLTGLIVSVCLLMLLSSHGYFFTLSTRLLSLSRFTSDASFSDRFDLAKSAVEMFLERPVFGWGLSCFPFYAGWAHVEDGPHNVILELLCEVGIAGLLSFVAMLAISAHRLRVIRTGLPVVNALWYGLAFWILTIPTLGLSAARPFLSLLAVINARITTDSRTEGQCVRTHTGQ